MKKVNSEFSKERNIEIGRKIKNRRRELGMTQEELAEKLGYKHKSSINKLENGTNELQLNAIIKIAEILDIEFEQLACLDDFITQDNEINVAAQASHKLIYDPELSEIVLKISKLKPEKRQQVIQAINLMLN